MSAAIRNTPQASWPLDVPSSHRGEGTIVCRYEDISQDGRIGLRPLSHGIGAAVWRSRLLGHPSYRLLQEAGIVPILSRVVVSGGGGPISVGAVVSAEGTFDLTRALDERGEARLRFDMWARMQAPAGRTFGPPPPNHGVAIPLGSMYAEHVLTRLFAPAAERKVEALPVGVDLIAREGRWSAPQELLAPPEGCVFVGDEVLDPTVTVFGLGHTDSNQHVNSLVYPLLLEEAALRLGGGGLGLGVLAPVERFVDYGEFRYRKPFFAGQACQITLRPYRRTEGEARFGVVARFAPPKDADPLRAHVYAHLELVP